MTVILSEIFIAECVYWSICESSWTEIHEHMLYLGYIPSQEAIEIRLGASHLWQYVLKMVMIHFLYSISHKICQIYHIFAEEQLMSLFEEQLRG